MSAILSVSGLSKSFGAVVVAEDTSFDIEKGAAVGILGPNGAGKTSLFNLITGALKPNSGYIEFAGADITALPPAKRCKMGIARSFQVPQPFSGMTVFENALVGATLGAGLSARDAQTCAGCAASDRAFGQGKRACGSIVTFGPEAFGNGTCAGGKAKVTSTR